VAEAAQAPDVADRMTLLETALSAGGDRFEPAAVERTRAALERAGQRMHLGADLTVVAIAGATGCGKSTLFNALAGMEISEVAAHRPTTNHPMACVWGVDEAAPLLDWLGIPERNRTRRESILDADRQAPLQGLVLLDLPDHDSAFLDHRLEVDRLIELVDLLVWVVDPQKYADETLHSGYLKPLSGHDDVMLVVLNQIDKLDPAEVATCSQDLRRLLDADGLESVGLLTTAAIQGEGVEDLRDVLAQVVHGRLSATERAFADLTVAAANLRAGTGEIEPEPQDLPVATELISALGESAGLPVALDAVESDYRRKAAHYLDWPFLCWWRRVRPDPLTKVALGGVENELRVLTRATMPAATPAQRARVELAVRSVAEDMAAALPPRWAQAVRSAESTPDDVAETLDAAVGGVDLTLREPAWWRPLGGLEIAIAALTMLGFVWLVGIGIVDWVRVSTYTPPFIGSIPLPTALFLGGLLIGGLLAVVARVLLIQGARQWREEIAARLNESVSELAWAHVLAPVAAVLADHRTAREALASVG
jgi:GTPase Era involved in 16S rRNA processing